MLPGYLKISLLLPRSSPDVTDGGVENVLVPPCCTFVISLRTFKRTGFLILRIMSGSFKVLMSCLFT